MIQIDGSLLEGGGQLVRTAVCLSALTSRHIEVIKIRDGRQDKGLKSQHLTGVRLVANICGASLTGHQIGSTRITFKPNWINGGQYNGHIQTAGSITLLLQISLPCVLFGGGKSRLSFKGGTNVEMAPQIDYTIHVLKPILEKFGAYFDCDIIRRGYYPKGGGEVEFGVEAVPSLKPIQMIDFANLVSIKGYSFVAGVLPIKMAHLMADSAIAEIKKQFPNVSIDIKRVKESPDKSVGNGSGIVIIAESSTGCKLCGSALGKRSLTPEEVGETAAKHLIEELNSGAAVDRHTQDQLIIFMALAKGKSVIKSAALTLHTQTVIHIVKLFTNATFNATPIPNTQLFLIECNGIGLINQNI